MSNFEYMKGLYIARTFLKGCMLTGVLCITMQTKAEVVESKPAAPSSITLDAKRYYALGMIETGNNDREVGAIGEISRYQIHPSVWKSYTSSRDYVNPAISRQVAKLHWDYLANYFKKKTGQDPKDFDMYVMWNTNFGYYAKRGFNPKRLDAVVRDRAERFVNLVNKQDIPTRELLAKN